MNNKQKALEDPSLLLTPHPSFRCGETINLHDISSCDSDDDEDVGKVKFSCTIPIEDNDDDTSITTLHFRCRDQSVGFLNPDETSASNNQETLESVQEVMDPNFFDKGYSLAGRTGFQIWAGSRVMMEALLHWHNDSSISSPDRLVGSTSANDQLEKYQKQIKTGANILEFGSGVGVVGTSLAAVGGKVLMTDLKTLVDHSLWPNIMANITEDNMKKTNDETPFWLGEHVTKVKKGWASAIPLDWTKSVSDQLQKEQIENVELIISCDCVWLVSMMDGVLNSAALVFEMSKSEDITLLMSFQRRDNKDGSKSETFTTVEGVLASVEARGWKVKCLAWRPVVVKGIDDFREKKDVFIFEIRP